uniref:Lamin n=1 Tax=Romanomermis culicivorax TaxID=13658 RepID=A0A915JJW1_ROMCU
RSSEDIIVRERNNVRSAFETELAEARSLLDETARERARLQIESSKYKTLVDELNIKIGKLERDLKDSETRRLYVESQVQDLQGKLNTADSQRKHWEDETKKIRAENNDLRKQLENARRQLEDETVHRVDLENRLQSAKEELLFNRNLFDKELDESRQKRTVELTEINQQIEDEYKAKLQEALRDMREQLDATIRINRKEIEDMYENKMQDLRDMADRNRESAARAREELKRVKLQLETVESSKQDFDAKLAAAERKIKDLQDQLGAAESDFYNRLHTREDEIRRLQEEIATMMQDYQDLMDTKIQLDVEIEAYRRLIEGEEMRLFLNQLHLSPTPPGSAAASASAKRGIKRKRMMEERDITEHISYETKHGAEGDVEISEHQLDGTYVKIANLGDKDIHIGGWILKREAGGLEVTYKFHNKLVLKGGKTVTIYSSNTDATHAPPEILVMKNQQWPVKGEKIRTSLTNSDDDVVAWRESIRSSSTKRTSYRTLGGAAFNEDDPVGLSSLESRFLRKARKSIP